MFRDTRLEIAVWPIEFPNTFCAIGPQQEIPT
jgi:hypothetical protein